MSHIPKAELIICPFCGVLFQPKDYHRTCPSCQKQSMSWPGQVLSMKERDGKLEFV